MTDTQESLNTANNTNNEEKTEVDEKSKIIEWIGQLKDSNLRMKALVALSQKRETFADLAIYLWYTPGVIAAL
jgi:hypothetical protein